MAFVKKTWKDRIAEFPTRRRLTKEDNTSELVTVAREEGTLSQEGDAFSAENMNDLENRIDAEFTEVNGNLIYRDYEFTNFTASMSSYVEIDPIEGYYPISAVLTKSTSIGIYVQNPTHVPNLSAKHMIPIFSRNGSAYTVSFTLRVVFIKQQ